MPPRAPFDESDQPPSSPSATDMPSATQSLSPGTGQDDAGFDFWRDDIGNDLVQRTL